MKNTFGRGVSACTKEMTLLLIDPGDDIYIISHFTFVHFWMFMVMQTREQNHTLLDVTNTNKAGMWVEMEMVFPTLRERERERESFKETKTKPKTAKSFHDLLINQQQEELGNWSEEGNQSWETGSKC